MTSISIQKSYHLCQPMIHIIKRFHAGQIHNMLPDHWILECLFDSWIIYWGCFLSDSSSLFTPLHPYRNDCSAQKQRQLSYHLWLAPHIESTNTTVEKRWLRDWISFRGIFTQPHFVRARRRGPSFFIYWLKSNWF